MDDEIILPNLSKLYDKCALWDDSPFLTGFVQDNEPAYINLKKAFAETTLAEICWDTICNFFKRLLGLKPVL